MNGKYGDSTRSVKAVGSEAIPGRPVAPPPVPASTYHLSPDETESLDSYGRSSNPTWRQLESALAELEGWSRKEEKDELVRQVRETLNRIAA